MYSQHVSEKLELMKLHSQSYTENGYNFDVDYLYIEICHSSALLSQFFFAVTLSWMFCMVSALQ